MTLGNASFNLMFNPNSVIETIDLIQMDKRYENLSNPHIL